MQKDVSKIFKALCDPQRVEIIKILKNGESCACHLSERTNIAQSKLSYHMKILCESGLIECWYIGKWTHYKISDEGSQNSIEILTTLLK